jgi:hypothetical protein
LSGRACKVRITGTEDALLIMKMQNREKLWLIIICGEEIKVSL